MRDQGTFFNCAPYGTCWEPKEQAASTSTQPRPEDPAVTEALARQTVSVSQLQQGGGKQVGTGQAGGGAPGQTGPTVIYPYDFSLFAAVAAESLLAQSRQRSAGDESLPLPLGGLPHGKLDSARTPVCVGGGGPSGIIIIRTTG